MTSVPQPDPQREAMAAARGRIDQVNEWLRVGGAVPVSEAERLLAAGVTHVVDLREATEFQADEVAYPSIARHHVPVPNTSAPTLEQLEELSQWLEASEPTGVYVHCAGGFGRAATMAVGLLVHRGASVDEAEAEVRAARPEIRINDEQRAWLQSVEAQRPERS